MALQERLKQGLLLHQAGKLADAERIYEEVLEQQPNHAGALHLLGILAGQTQRAHRAVDLLQKAIARNPNIAAAHNDLGTALKEVKRPSDALASYDRAIALRPDYAEAHNNRGNALLELRRAVDAIASYDKAIALKPESAEAYYNRGNALKVLKRLDEALASYGHAIALKPDYGEAHNNRGNTLLDLKRPVEALASFDTALRLQAAYAEAHNNQGNALSSLKRFDEAVASYDSALQLRPAYAEANNNRGNALTDLGQFEEALESYDKALALKPDYAEVFANRGNALVNLRRSEEALASYDRAIALQPDHVEAYWNQCLCLLQMGRFDQGWRQYEWRKKRDKSAGARSFSKPLWLGAENIAGKTLFLHWEQGYGDTIQFCRYAQLVEALGANIVMSVQAPLLGLLKQISSTIQITDSTEPPVEFDFHCPMLSLPLAMGTRVEAIPAQTRYLTADDKLIAFWSARLPAKTKPRVGVVWNGSRIHENDRNRSMSLETFRPLLSQSCEWICLQKEMREEDAAGLRHDGGISFFGEDLRDFSDTAALVELMDMVITIDTSVAHLAGAMGKPVWILLPHNPDWRWLLDRHDSPWYPSARLFRQQKNGHWSDVIGQVKEQLRCIVVENVSLATERRNTNG